MFKAKLAGLVAGLVLTGSASANLIVNGSFEDNLVGNGGWNYFSSANVNGWDGSNIEIWHNMNGISAPDGQQIAELNAHPYSGQLFSIYQHFSTQVGQAYDVSFFYRARSSNNESFNFSVGNVSALINDHVVSHWSEFNTSFIANSSVTELRFTSTDMGTVGNLLDAVKVEATVPEASSMALFAFGMLGLVFARRNTRA